MACCQVYADHAATTRPSRQAVAAMLPWLREGYGNPSSLYRQGREARRAVEAARMQLAQILGCQPGEVFFTSGGTESDNWALRGTIKALAPQAKSRLITTQVEHHAILHTARALEAQGFPVTYLPVDRWGLVSPRQLEAALGDDVALVSVMYANNEIGTLQPIEELAYLCRSRGVLFHTDAVQGVGHLPIDFHCQQLDLLSLSAHKFHGPKGVGALLIRQGIPFPTNLMEGGGQERGRRAGTENVPGIVAMGVALQESAAGMNCHIHRLMPMRDRLIRGLLQLPGCTLNGHPTRRLPGNVHLSFAGVDGADLIPLLDDAGIAASTGSACSAGSQEVSHVLTAIGLPQELARGSLRLTLGACNTMTDVDFLLQRIPPIICRLRSQSPSA